MTRTEKDSSNKPRKCHLTQLKPVAQVKWEAKLNNMTQLPKKISLPMIFTVAPCMSLQLFL
jgi:hypothetical protein